MVIILNSPVAVSLNSEMERLKSDLRLNLFKFCKPGQSVFHRG
jgi:hypothetical protein